MAIRALLLAATRAPARVERRTHPYVAPTRRATLRMTAVTTAGVVAASHGPDRREECGQTLAQATASNLLWIACVQLMLCPGEGGIRQSFLFHLQFKQRRMLETHLVSPSC